MQSIKVDSFVRNCTDASLNKNSDDWIAFKITRIMKGEEFPYPFSMKCNGTDTQIHSSNPSMCLDEIYRQCAIRLSERLGGNACTIVPVPNSNACPADQQFKTRQHAARIADLFDGQVIALPMLLWCAPQQKVHKGGRSRQYREHLQKLIINGTTNRSIVLYDDVVTSGSQLVASKIKLEQAGFSILGFMTVVSILEQDGATHSEVFSWKEEPRVCL